MCNHAMNWWKFSFFSFRFHLYDFSIDIHIRVIQIGLIVAKIYEFLQVHMSIVKHTRMIDSLNKYYDEVLFLFL